MAFSRSTSLRRLGPLLSVLLCCLLASAMFARAVDATEVTWTPNDDAENAPLPLSTRQRQQLLKLEQAIRDSPDPQGTLQQVAEANQMSVQDLVNMLEKNARDLAQNPSLARHSLVIGKAFKLLGVMLANLVHVAWKHPRAAAFLVGMLASVVYGLSTASRTGIVLSTGPGILFKGPTTVLSPPAAYLARLASSDRLLHGQRSVEADGVKWDDLRSTDSPRKFVQSSAAQATLDVESLLTQYGFDDHEIEELWEEVVDMIYENAVSVLKARQLTEFVPERNGVAMQYVPSSDKDRKHGVLSVQRLGNFGRYGIVFLRTLQAETSETESTLVLSTVKGGNPIDCLVRIHCERVDDGVDLHVQMAIPRGGRRTSQNIADSLPSGMLESIKESTLKRCQLKLTRQLQSSRFKGLGQSKAKQRRHSRFVKEKEIEEMAAERRRRWQRRNPDAGRYRPSGVRQQSPNNC